MKLDCNDAVLQRAKSTRIPCILRNGEQVASRKELTPEELLEYQKEALVAKGDNWIWVEACIKPAGRSDWLVFDEEGNQINVVNVFFTGTGHIYSVMVGNVRNEFRHRPYAVAASFAYKD